MANGNMTYEERQALIAKNQMKQTLEIEAKRDKSKAKYANWQEFGDILQVPGWGFRPPTPKATDAIDELIKLDEINKIKTKG
jgi:hypothetical protein